MGLMLALIYGQAAKLGRIWRYGPMLVVVSLAARIVVSEIKVTSGAAWLAERGLTTSPDSVRLYWWARSSLRGGALIETLRTEGFDGNAVMASVLGPIIRVAEMSMRDAFLLSTLMGMLGTVILARVCVSSGSRKWGPRGAVACLLMPAFLYWPSGLAKESFILLGLALVSLSAASQRHRVLSAGAGVTLIYLVRPPVALVVLVSLVGAYVLVGYRRRHGGLSRRSGAVALAIVLAFMLALAYSDFIVPEELELQRERTVVGQTSFEPPSWRGNFALVPVAAASSLSRPFPWEAGASLEGLVLGFDGLFSVIGAGVALVAAVRGNTHRSSTIVFSILGAGALLSTLFEIGNFGLLARLRLQSLILFVVGASTLPARSPKSQVGSGKAKAKAKAKAGAGAGDQHPGAALDVAGNKVVKF